MKAAVIGAGVSGLTCVKICLDYGIDVKCFEKSDDIGGLWCYQPEPKHGVTTVMKSTIINTSKEFMCYSDFPPPDHFPNYMHNTKLMEYLRMYAKHFELIPYIELNTEVTYVQRADDYDSTGRWRVKFIDHKTNTSKEEIFDGVFVANGHHSEPYVPKFQGTEKFKGQMLHSQLYKDCKGFEGKRISVVGIGNSGGDIAVELSRTAAHVYLVTRSGSWCLNRVTGWGLPADSLILTRFWLFVYKYAYGLANGIVETYTNFRFTHYWYGLKCNHRLLDQHPTVSDDLPNRIISGMLTIKRGQIKKFGENSIEMDSGEVMKDIDVVVLATGYNITFPFLEKGLVEVDDDNKVHNLYKNIFPKNLTRQTLFIIGLVQPWGALSPIAELQARLCCEVLLRRVGLPTEPEMALQIQKDNEFVYSTFAPSRRHTIQCVYIDYMDNIASMIDVRPRVWFYLLTDFWLGVNLLFAPSTPYQYRLTGPHWWAEARKTQLGVWRRILYPLKSCGGTVSIPRQKKSKLVKYLVPKKIVSYFLMIMLFLSYTLWFM